MSYLGNDPNQDINSFIVGVDRFSGTGACTQFTLTRDLDDAKAVEITVNGVQQDPDNSYTVTNGLLTFDEAPSVGANNILVTYRAPIVVTYNSVTSTQLEPASVTESKIAPIAVTETKIGVAAVTGNKIADTAIRANNIATGQITGNLIATGAVSGNQISLGAVSGNQIGLYAVSGNQIGIGAISANNFAGGGITSNVLASNLTVSISRTLETATINSTAIGGGGNSNIDVVNNTVYLFTSAATANMQFNLRANSTHTFDAVTNIGQTTSVAIAVPTVTNRYTANLMIDNVRQTLVFAGNGRPSFTSAGLLPGEYNIFTYSVFKTGAATYTVFASNTLFGTA